MCSGGEPGLEQIEPFASSFASTPRELVGTAQRMRVFRPDVPDAVSACRCPDRERSYPVS
jgi:hypothetical protein